MQKSVSDNDNDNPARSQRANAVDRHVGSRIRERRLMLGLSQQQLAGRIGVTYQQAFKYEHGTNRVSAGRLFAFAQAMNVSPSWFFEGLQPDAISKPSSHQRKILELMRNFSLIVQDSHQEALGQMAVKLLKKPAAVPRHLILPPVLRQRAPSTRREDD